MRPLLYLVIDFTSPTQWLFMGTTEANIEHIHQGPYVRWRSPKPDLHAHRFEKPGHTVTTTICRSQQTPPRCALTWKKHHQNILNPIATANGALLRKPIRRKFSVHSLYVFKTIGATICTVDATALSVLTMSPTLSAIFDQDKQYHIDWCKNISLWRHQMEICSALLALCEGNTPVTGEIP